MRAVLLLSLFVAACSSSSEQPISVDNDTGVEPADTAPETPPRCTLDRTADDRPDDTDGYQVRAFYVIPSDAPDEEHDINGRIERSVSAWNDWLKTASGGTNLRLDTCDGKLDIGFLRLSKTDAEVIARGAYVREAIQAEMPRRDKKIIAAYYGGGSTYSCGGGAWPPELVGHVASMYLHGTPPGPRTCDVHELARPDIPLGYFEFGMLHEIFHTLGAAAYCAPHHFERGHVSEDPRDLLYRGDQPWTPEILDIGGDDYWAHPNTGCLDVSKSVFLEPLPEGAEAPPRW
jgi:hypothetical protein